MQSFHKNLFIRTAWRGSKFFTFHSSLKITPTQLLQVVLKRHRSKRGLRHERCE